MKKKYLDIMEKALSAYTDERIRDYIDEVRRDGLTEHGFPRLASNIGILIANGRRTELLDLFTEIMDICCSEIPLKKAANDFSIREVCCCLMLFEKNEILSRDLLEKWKRQLGTFDPWKFYTVVDDHSGNFVGNWALFAAVSEFMRGVFLGIDTSEFVDWQIPSQLVNLDCNDMYKDNPPSNHYANPIVYDMVPRFLFAFLLRAGYKGKYVSRIEQILDNTVDLTLKMQSVTGETAFGGRSNQLLNNEAMLVSYFEMEAARFAQKGELEKAAELKAAAELAAQATLGYLNLDPISHVKNRYDVSTKIGCENYAYFNKYMITVASNIYAGLLFLDDSVSPMFPLGKRGGYVARTSESFGKTFLFASDYFVELETNADIHYDANGVGRVHKRGCPSAICISVPFPSDPNYTLEGKNKTAMSICCYAEKDGKKLLGAEDYADYRFVDSACDEDRVKAMFDVRLPQAITVRHEYTVSHTGVDISLSGYKNIGFMLPVFDFDGKENTNITKGRNLITIEYQGSVCEYHFEGEISANFEYYYNRNGRYRVYSVNSKKLHVEIK